VWWPSTQAWLVRKDPASETRHGVPIATAEDPFPSGEDEKVLMFGKPRPCVILSPLMDIKADAVRDVTLLHTRSYKRLSRQTGKDVRNNLVPHAFPLPVSPKGNLEDRWVDFTAHSSIPKEYLKGARWTPILQMGPDLLDRLLARYGQWLMRDVQGKF
jgi:hypothetical protein